MIKKAKYATKVNNSNAAEVQRLNTRVDELLREREAMASALKFTLEVLEIQCARQGLDHKTATPDSAIGRARAALGAKP